MFLASRWRIARFLLISLAASGSLVGCHKDRVQEANGVVDAASTRQSLEGLKPRLRALSTKFAAMHKQVDPLPLNLPGFEQVRAKFYNTDEGLGIMAPKIDWLSGRLESALKSGNGAQLRQVSKDIAKTYHELQLIDQIARELLRQLPPFQKLAAQLVEQNNEAGR